MHTNTIYIQTAAALYEDAVPLCGPAQCHPGRGHEEVRYCYSVLYIVCMICIVCV